ncbi:unnamed protein product (macronuclear) [Paramecium tetraurelia]|uniref:6-phosphofructo-2-kinase domain-containing protein n=1 Tax=Paramecium tetraurelia TaxID=5888 RepID=A0C4I4_PARTE|nr:uncharacterized protein GSPATT00035181001 [Paramecium tetraurelia]CAK65701.1 unnamed protein product [Paramecium tetraurelia]|eukprot:XP_001433098.1 hypothetical protein (macronuclear) [Paramecium tetraurelia strain d4-2]
MQELGKQQKMVIGMVGLPARGKTYISRKICRYLNWMGFKSKVFNIGNYRRQICGTDCNSNFFDPGNKDASKARDECALLALNDMINYLRNEGDVSLYDGTNTTKQRRKLIMETLQQKFSEVQVFWVESICNDEDVILRNIQLTKLNNPDYVGKSSDEATQDFQQRIEQYTKVYEPIDMDENISFIKIIDIGNDIMIYNIQGFLQSKLVSYLMNLHIYPRPIYLSRHGESQYNVGHKVGGDSDLTQTGLMYAKQLGKYFVQELEGNRNIKMITSTMQRALRTSNEVCELLGIEYYSLKALDEINPGICDGLTYQQIADKFPQDYEERKMNKLTYRYPRGESYLDVISRVEQIIFEIERSRLPVIVIAHQAILRCLYAYFHEHEVPEIPKLNIPLHQVIKLVPAAYYCKETRIKIDPMTGHWEIQDEATIKKVKSFLDL